MAYINGKEILFSPHIHILHSNIFWSAHQQDGERTECDYAYYGPGWNDISFTPEYDIRPITAEYCFSRSEITNLEKILKDRGVQFDTSQVNRLYGVFKDSSITHAPLLDCRAATVTTQLYNGCTNLVSAGMIVAETTSYGSTFNHCYELVTLIVKGTIGRSSFNVGSSPKLDKPSLVSIVTALSSNTSGLHVTVSKTAVNNAFETADGLADGSTSEEWLVLVATKPNWTISLA